MNNLCNELSDLKEILEKELARHFAEYGEPYGVGRNRAVWIITDEFGVKYAYKVPRNQYGIVDNTHEAKTYSEAKNTLLAKCILLEGNDGLPICKMEYVPHMTDEQAISLTLEQKDLMGWYDCGQLGFTEDGRFVVFDYGFF